MPVRVLTPLAFPTCTKTSLTQVSIWRSSMFLMFSLRSNTGPVQMAHAINETSQRSYACANGGKVPKAMGAS